MIGEIKTYLIMDVHPKDSWHSRRQNLIGTRLVTRDMRPCDLPEYEGYFTGTGITQDSPWPKKHFLALQLEEVTG